MGGGYGVGAWTGTAPKRKPELEQLRAFGFASPAIFGVLVNDSIRFVSFRLKGKLCVGQYLARKITHSRYFKKRGI